MSRDCRDISCAVQASACLALIVDNDLASPSVVFQFQ